jgi:alkanesulfonate monooxygenase SsuD/methylene tetrahydromethanopterin reductase-like flavin-dependent oxidoreductase (luciferase family)
MAANRGLGVLSFSFNYENITQALKAYRIACKSRDDLVVKVPNERFASLVICHVAENDEQEAIGIDGARWFLHNVAKLFEPLMAKNELYSYEYLRTIFDLEADANELTDAQLKQHPMVIVGRPEEVIRKIERFQDAGIDQLILFKQAGRIPHQKIMDSIRRVGKHIIPHFNPHRASALA